MSYKLTLENNETIEFERLKVWRDELITRELKNPKEIKPKIVVKTILKYSIKSYREISFTYEEYQKNEKLLDEINIDISESDLEKFAKLFLENHDDFTSDGENKLISKFMDIGIDKLQNAIGKLYQNWCIHHQENEEWVKKVLGVTGMFSGMGIDKLRQQDKAVKAKLTKIEPSYSQELSNLHLDRINHQTKVDFAIIQSRDLLSQLIDAQISIYDSLKDQQKAANEILSEQLNQSKTDSRSANKFSKMAIMLSLLAIVFSIFTGGYQIFQNHTTGNDIKNISNHLNSGILNVKDISNKKSIDEINNEAFIKLFFELQAKKDSIEALKLKQ
jgi:hypothetical protein